MFTWKYFLAFSPAFFSSALIFCIANLAADSKAFERATMLFTPSAVAVSCAFSGSVGVFMGYFLCFYFLGTRRF